MNKTLKYYLSLLFVLIIPFSVVLFCTMNKTYPGYYVTSVYYLCAAFCVALLAEILKSCQPTQSKIKKYFRSVLANRYLIFCLTTLALLVIFSEPVVTQADIFLQSVAQGLYLEKKSIFSEESAPLYFENIKLIDKRPAITPPLLPYILSAWNSVLGFSLSSILSLKKLVIGFILFRIMALDIQKIGLNLVNIAATFVFCALLTGILENVSLNESIQIAILLTMFLLATHPCEKNPTANTLHLTISFISLLAFNATLAFPAGLFFMIYGIRKNMNLLSEVIGKLLLPILILLLLESIYVIVKIKTTSPFNLLSSESLYVGLTAASCAVMSNYFVNLKCQGSKINLAGKNKMFLILSMLVLFLCCTAVLVNPFHLSPFLQSIILILFGLPVFSFLKLGIIRKTSLIILTAFIVLGTIGAFIRFENENSTYTSVHAEFFNKSLNAIKPFNKSKFLIISPHPQIFTIQNYFSLDSDNLSVVRHFIKRFHFQHAVLIIPRNSSSVNRLKNIFSRGFSVELTEVFSLSNSKEYEIYVFSRTQ